MFTLDKLQPLVKKRKRIGRGGSRGGTSGKGHKGQKARSGGGVDIGFEGGQMPLYRRLPKRGFTNARFKKSVCIVSLDSLNRLAQSYDEITTDILLKEGIIKPKKHQPFLVKVLGDGTVSKPFTITADAFSATAREVIEKAGGKALPSKG